MKALIQAQEQSVNCTHFVFALVQIHTVSVCHLKLAGTIPKTTGSCLEASDTM